MSTAHASPLRRVLIANRGEIAIRIARACRDLSIQPVAVYSDADADSLHVALAAEAVAIGPAPARDSYLRADAIVEAATRIEAEAVHPGYGFLAEDPRLPAACAEAGLIFVGPPADVMARVGDKVAAREAAVRAGVPVVPGSPGRVERPAAAAEVAEEIGYPILLKAAAGGGGRGIRAVEDADEMDATFARATREAAAAFGDGGLFVEKQIQQPHHVEVQVMADAHGSVLHLYERDCSTQRRKQKLIEETPAPGLTALLREEICDAAVRLSREAGYLSAGTCEFIVDVAAGAFYFIEMNARIQVEHGITELVTGVDIVAEQLRIAAGHRLSVQQQDVAPRGAAIELRINAEDPDRDFLPCPGEITAWHVPSGPGVRFDSGVEAGRAVVPFYDSLIGKLMVWGRDREQAFARARRALEELRVEGINTTQSLCRRLLDWDDLLEGRVATESLEQLLAEPSPAG